MGSALESQYTVYSVVATRIRPAKSGNGSQDQGHSYDGYMLSEPAVGRSIVLFRDVNGRRMITSPVRRVLQTPETGVYYIETENSVYRLQLVEYVARPSSAPLPAANVAFSRAGM